MTDWRPDLQLIPAILAGSKTRWEDLCVEDRAWAVAGLRRAGYTAEQIRDRMGCALRTAKAMAAEPITVLCGLLQAESEHFADELRLVQGELRQQVADLRAACTDRDRYRKQLISLISVQLAGDDANVFRCGCPRTRYNAYIAPKTGKVGCRKHRGLAVARHRERLRLTHGQDTVIQSAG